MKIAMYGGSFNPPHNGHLHLAEEISRKLMLDKVVIIPSNISPQKTHNGNIDPLHRINMCKKAFSSELFEVSDCEIARGGRSFTFDTLNYLKTLYPDDELYLLMGADMLLSFHTWYRYEDILSLCSICAVSRDDKDNAEVLRSYAESHLAKGKVYVVDIKPFEVSSSEIREKLAEGENCENLLSKEVSDYIKENKLYVQ